MGKRHVDAVAIQTGVTNPIAVSRALIDAIDEARAERLGTYAICQDPAVRLICHQLAFLLCTAEFDRVENDAYSAALAACKAAQHELPTLLPRPFSSAS